MMLFTDNNDIFSDHLLKLLLMGDANVGKSSLLLRFVVNTFECIFVKFVNICSRMIPSVKVISQLSVLIS